MYPVDEEIVYFQWEHPSHKYIYTEDESYSIDNKSFTIKFPCNYCSYYFYCFMLFMYYINELFNVFLDKNKEDIGQWKCIIRLNGSDNNLYEGIYDLKIEQNELPKDENIYFSVFFIVFDFVVVFLLMLVILLIYLYRLEVCTPSVDDTNIQVR